MSSTATTLLLIGLGLVVGWVLGASLGAALTRRRLLRSVFQESDSRQERFLVAIDHVLQGAPGEAYEILCGMAREGDAPVELYFALAALLRAQARADRAAQVYRTILVRPGLPRETRDRARIGLARALVELGRGDEAKEIIESLPRRVRSEAGLLELESRAALQRGDWDDAVSAGQALAKAEGGNGAARAEAYNRVAEQAAASGDSEAAFRSFRKALKLEPDSVRAQYGLARLYRAEGKLSKARRQLVATLHANPSLFPVLLPELRHLLGANGSDQEARFRELLIELGDDPGIGLWVGLERADRLYLTGRLEEARGLLEGLTKNYPRSLEAHEAYLNLLLESGDEEALAKAIARFIDLAAEEIRRFRCGQCGYLSTRPFLECPSCQTVGALRYQAG